MVPTAWTPTDHGQSSRGHIRMFSLHPWSAALSTGSGAIPGGDQQAWSGKLFRTPPSSEGWLLVLSSRFPDTNQALVSPGGTTQLPV